MVVEHQFNDLQGCIFRLTCSYPELTEDHVLTSAYVKIFRTATRYAVNKSVWGKKYCSWPPLNKYAMNIWLNSLRIRAHLSWRTGKHLHFLHVLRTYSTCSYPGYRDTTTYAALSAFMHQDIYVWLLRMILEGPGGRQVNWQGRSHGVLSTVDAEWYDCKRTQMTPLKPSQLSRCLTFSISMWCSSIFLSILELLICLKDLYGVDSNSGVRRVVWTKSEKKQFFLRIPSLS